MESLASVELSGDGAGTLFAAVTAASAAIRGAAVEANCLEAEMYGSAARLEAMKTGKASAPRKGAAFSWSLGRGAEKAGTLSFSGAPAPGGAFAAAAGETFAEGEIVARGRDGMFAPTARVREFVAQRLFPGMDAARNGADGGDTGAGKPSMLSRILLFAVLSVPVAGFIWMCIRFKWI